MHRCYKSSFCMLDEDSVSNGELESKTLVVRDRGLLNSIWGIFPYIYRINDGSISSSSLLQQVCKERGWKEFGYADTFIGPWDEVTVRGAQCWNIWWRGPIMNPKRITFLKDWQITNHIPNASNFCRKDVLARYLRRMRETYRKIYDFSPLSFNLPKEYTRLLGEHNRRLSRLENGEPQDGKDLPFGINRFLPKGKKAPIWIAKPVGKSQGKGIIVLDNPAGLSYDRPCVVQEYIHRPLLINGYKWDLRLYVCVTCPNPLTIYAYREGITRFATKKYDLNDLFNAFSHLTNTSVNKQSPTYKKNKETIGYGCKWTLRQLRRYFKDHGQCDYYLWQRIWSILVLTIVGDGKDISKLNWKGSSFDFFGFDVLVDERMKPHLLEVNVNPGLGSDPINTVDEEVKKPLLHELFNLVGLPDGRDLCDCYTVPFLARGWRYQTSEQKILEQMLNSSKDAPNNRENTLRVLANRVGNTNLWSREETLPYPRDKSRRDFQSLIGERRTSYKKNFLEDNDDIPKYKKLRRKNNAEMDIEFPVSQVIPPINVRVPVLKGTKVEYRFPKNGPGLNFGAKNWEAESPNSCGNWVKIFPFDKITEEKCRFKTEDGIRGSITQVTEYLKQVKEVIRTTNTTCQLDDCFYDAKIKESGAFVADVWYPYV